MAHRVISGIKMPVHTADADSFSRWSYGCLCLLCDDQVMADYM